MGKKELRQRERNVWRPKNVTWSEKRTRQRANEAVIKKKCEKGSEGFKKTICSKCS